VKSKKLSFANTNGETVYNPTIPFEHGGKKYMGVRVESLGSESDSRTCFAYEQDEEENLWKIDHSLDSLPLQDPSYVRINKKTFILGVRVREEKGYIKYRQDIYYGDSINNLEYFASGPDGMKDIRLVELKDKIGIFTRPQGKIGNRGKIGYFEVEDINELKNFTEDDWYNRAEIIEGLFTDDQWGGVNQAIHLHEKGIGVIGHIAHQTISEESLLEKHYATMAFLFDPVSKITSKFKIIAQRKDFPPSASKRSPELDDIVFSAGVDTKTNILYCGLSDYCIGQREIENPF